MPTNVIPIDIGTLVSVTCGTAKALGGTWSKVLPNYVIQAGCLWCFHIKDSERRSFRVGSL